MNLVKTLLIFVWSILRRDSSPKIILYHDIGAKYTPMGTALQLFKKHLQIIRQKRKDNGRFDVICFDDGFRGLWDHRELIKTFEGQVKVSVAPRLVGLPGYLTWDEIRILAREYGVGVICHSWSHQTMVGEMIDESPIEARTEAWYERELIASKEKIVDEINREVDGFCFPVGYFNEDLIEQCKEIGYKKVYMTYPGNIVDEYIQPRCLVQHLTPLAFKGVLNGGLNVFRKRYLKMHHIADVSEQ